MVYVVRRVASARCMLRGILLPACARAMAGSDASARRALHRPGRPAKAPGRRERCEAELEGNTHCCACACASVEWEGREREGGRKRAHLSTEAALVLALACLAEVREGVHADADDVQPYALPAKAASIARPTEADALRGAAWHDYT
jgi:hypothetical protein